MPKERPKIPNLINKNTTEIEKFQNETIRPIIKMQHVLLVNHFAFYVQKRKINLDSFTEEQRKKRVQSIFKTDSSLKKMNLGFIIGHFSEEEYFFYTRHNSEINRRILQIIAQRINDSLYQNKTAT